MGENGEGVVANTRKSFANGLLIKFSFPRLHIIIKYMKLILTKQEAVDILNKKKTIEEIVEEAEIRIEDIPLPPYTLPINSVPHLHNGRICYNNPCVWC